MITQTINLNMVPGSVYPVIHVSQYDNDSGALKFNLFNGSAFSVPAGSAVVINGTKPDGYGFSYGLSEDRGAKKPPQVFPGRCYRCRRAGISLFDGEAVGSLAESLIFLGLALRPYGEGECEVQCEHLHKALGIHPVADVTHSDRIRLGRGQSDELLYVLH